jgi:hypothetical protein
MGGFAAGAWAVKMAANASASRRDSIYSIYCGFSLIFHTVDTILEAWSS